MLNVEIVTPTGLAWTGEVTEIQLPGAQGELGVLDGHAMLLAVTRAGVVRVSGPHLEQPDLIVGPGFAEVTPLGVTLLVDQVQPATDVDKAQAQQDLVTAEAALALSQQDTDAWREAEYQADLARARLSA
ncbi:MAG: ATP synthase F1 subunit epsilon [Oligoflexia bacterium]|nr:ATP synthase F1 subunit epsilon [Oligoflexia bacterium]